MELAYVSTEVSSDRVQPHQLRESFTQIFKN